MSKRFALILDLTAISDLLIGFQQMRYRWKDTAEHYKMIQKHVKKWRTEAEESKMKILGFFSTTGMTFKFLQWKIYSLLIMYVKFHFHAYHG